jgi:predicted CXXCH cytochrome family protein
MRWRKGVVPAFGGAIAVAVGLLAAVPALHPQTPQDSAAAQPQSAPDSAAVQVETLPDSKECVECHLKQTDERLSAPPHTYGDDIHAKRRLGCLSCHGPAAKKHQENPEDLSFRKPLRQNIPALCGQCHSDAEYMRRFNPSLRTDQVKEYWTSVHGQLLRSENDTSVAVCVSCHPAHDIRPLTDPQSSVFPTNVIETCGRCHSDEARMAKYGIPTDQVEEYGKSVHAEKLLEEGDISAPVCNDCHGNHGATPPEVSSVLNVCGQCHSVIADKFERSEHAEIFGYDDLPGCATCHSNHAIVKPTNETLRQRYEQVCSECHPTDDPAGQNFPKMAQLLDSLDASIAWSRAILEDARNKGMEVSQALFDLDGVTNAQTAARNSIHTLHVDSVMEASDPGFKIAAVAETRGQEALVEHRFRRIGLGISAGIILLLITSLFLKLRDTEARASSAEGAVDEYFRRTMGESVSLGREQARVGAAAILLEAAYTDDDLSKADLSYVNGVVRTRFGLTPSDADALISLLERQRAYAGRLTRFATLISQNLSGDQLEMVLEELWRLVWSDETLAAHEIRILDDVAKLVHVDREVVAAACRRVTSATPGGVGTGTREDR